MKSAAITVLAVVVIGCSSRPAPPPTYPAIGIVKFATGQPFPGGILTLTSKADPRIVMESPINDDGTFSLSMVFDNRRVEGAQAGTYSVLVSSKFVARQAVRMYSLSDDVVIKPDANSLMITIGPEKERGQ
jgi:hypothetical protein